MEGLTARHIVCKQLYVKSNIDNLVSNFCCIIIFYCIVKCKLLEHPILGVFRSAFHQVVSKRGRSCGGECRRSCGVELYLEFFKMPPRSFEPREIDDLCDSIEGRMSKKIRADIISKM